MHASFLPPDQASRGQGTRVVPALLGTCAHHRNYTEGATERVWNTARDVTGVGTGSASGDHTLTPQRFYVKHKVTLRRGPESWLPASGPRFCASTARGRDYTLSLQGHAFWFEERIQVQGDPPRLPFLLAIAGCVLSVKSPPVPPQRPHAQNVPIDRVVCGVPPQAEAPILRVDNRTYLSR